MNSSDDRPAILGGVPVNPAGPPEWPPDDPAIAAALQAVAADGSWGRYHGSHCEALRDRLAALHGVPHVHLCSSGTAAVELALRGVGVGPGDEVLLAAYDFKGNIADVLALGATPVLIDVRPDDAQIDLARLEAAASDRTKAVLVSHLHGAAVDMPRLREVADARGWAVAEDACQTPGSPIHGRVAGTWGDAGVLSFGGSKLLTAGRGGAVVTSGDDVMQRIKLFTARGNDLSPLSELQAAVLLPQLDRLADRNATRAASAAALLGLLRDQPGLRPLASGGCRPSGHTGDTHRQGKVVPRSLSHSPGLYKLGFWYDHAACAGLPRDLFAAALRAEGIAMWPGFRALHRTHSRRRFRTVGDLPHAAEADADSLVLHHPVLLEGPEALRDVAAAVRKVRAFAEEIAARLPPPCRSSLDDPPPWPAGVIRYHLGRAAVPTAVFTLDRLFMMDYAAAFADAQPYESFLDRYATPEQRRRWDAAHAAVGLAADQRTLLGSFVREMKVLVLAGTWCGDCVEQCPIFDRFAAATDRIVLRFCDRDASPALADELSVCGAARVPAVLFLSEDDKPCGRYGDRTLSKYRTMAAGLSGAACPTGLGRDDLLTAAVARDWLGEFERIQLMLRTSGRLRQKHGD